MINLPAKGLLLRVLLPEDRVFPAQPVPAGDVQYERALDFPENDFLELHQVPHHGGQGDRPLPPLANYDLFNWL